MEETTNYKKIHVVAAIIYRESYDGIIQIFSAQRDHGTYQGFWEFPGGKVEEGESLEEALQREIREELSTSIKIESFFSNIEYEYPTYQVKLECFLCRFECENFILNEHASFRWLSLGELETVHWLPADISILKEIKNFFSRKQP